MGGLDKAAIELAGSTLLDRVLAAARPLCGQFVVVGPPRQLADSRGVTFCCEPRPEGGPAAAIVAALPQLPGSAVLALVLAADLVLLNTADLRRLLDTVVPDGPGPRAAAAREDTNGPHPLLVAHCLATLRATAAEQDDWTDMPAGRLLPPATAVIDLGPSATFNINRPEDLLRAQVLLGG